MATLQQAIRYEGDVIQAPISMIRLNFLVPVFDYSGLTPIDGALTRVQMGSEKVVIEHALIDTTYQALFPVSDLAGKTEQSVTNFLGYYIRATSENRINDLSVIIPVNYEATSAKVGETNLNVIFWVRNVSKLVDSVGIMVRGRAHPSFTETIAFLDRNLFLLNKDVYDRILAKFKDLTGRDDDMLLLRVIGHFLDETGLDPGSIEWNDDMIAKLRRLLTGEHLEDPGNRITGVIIETFKQIFDFPLTVPAIQKLEVAGDFQIRKPDQSAITLKDLILFELSVECPLVNVNVGTTTIKTPYDWYFSSDSIDGNKAKFVFTFAANLILQNAVDGAVTVSVKTYDGVPVWRNTFTAEDPNLKDLHIAVDQVKPATLNDPKGAGTDKQKKLRGQLLELKKDECPLKDQTVIIQAKVKDDDLWRVVAAGTTDASGNFSMPYPYGDYIAAQAMVSLMPDSPAEIPIRSDGNKNGTISDDFLYLLISNPQCTHDESDGDCGCNAPKKAPRLPDHADLINSDEYTQDIGGACVNLSTPNRTLSEYSYRGVVRTSDPEVANYTLNKNSDGSFDLVSSTTTIERTAISLGNPVRWADAPEAHENLTIYQAVTVATGHVLHYKAIFKADGYSLGNLLYSLALAPGQKKQIVVLDAAHQLQGTETQSIAQVESLAASLVNERNTLDQLSGALNETLNGNSSSSTGGVSAGLGAAGTIGFASASLGVAGGYSSANSSASQNSSRDTSMFFGEKLRQSIMQNAESYRQLNASVVTTVKEGQQFSVTTDVVANHNHCHALTMMYFEVLRHYAIYQELAQVEECVFVPLLMTHFTRKNIYKWSDVLASNLLPMPSNTYLQPIPYLRYRVSHPLIPAFDANARIETDYKFVDFPEKGKAYCDEPITSVTGYITLRVNIPRPKTVYDRVLSFPVVTRTQITDRNGGGIWGAICDVVSGPDLDKKSWEERQKFTDEHIVIYDNFQQARPADVIEVIKFDNIFNSGSQDDIPWRSIADLCGYSDIEAFLANYFSHKTISQWDTVFNDEILPVVFEKLVDNTLSIDPFSTCDFSTVGKYHGGERLMRINLQATTSQVRKDITTIKVTYTNIVKNPKTFWPVVTFMVENLHIGYTTKHYEGIIFNKTMGNSLTDGGTYGYPTPMNKDEQRNPREEDQYLVLKLLEHLNSNVEYYNKVLWRLLDPDRRYMMLDGFNIQIFNGQGVPVGSRSLASVIKNELLGITGNSLVFPVAAGYRVSQSYISEANAEGGEIEDVSLFDHYRPLTPIPPYRISVPSRGVFLEAVQGACDACEKVKENSSQDWTKFTTDEPTSVTPVTLPTPQLTDWKAAFKDFAQPLVNIQNAPALPDTGAGLASITDLLGKSGVFRDVTGLDATQQNAIRTYLSNQENAKAFAQMAQGMAMQQHNTEHSDKIMESLNNARSSDAISKEDYGKLVKEHLQKQIDGGEAQKRANELEQKKQETSPIRSAVDLANNSNRAVSATETDSSGNTKSIDVKRDELLQVGDNYVPPATAKNELIGLAGELHLADALTRDGLIVFRDWTKHVSEVGIDLIALDARNVDPNLWEIWLLDNKGQIKGISGANALTGDKFNVYKQQAIDFLKQKSPHPRAVEAGTLLENNKFRKVAANGWAGVDTRFTKKCFDSGLHVYDIRLGKLFEKFSEWESAFIAFKALPKGIRRLSGLRGAATVEAMLLVMLVSGGALYVLRSDSAQSILGELVAQTIFDTALSLLPGGFFAGLVVGLESDESPSQRAARKRAETIDEICGSIPGFTGMSPDEQKSIREEIGKLLDEPLFIPDPPSPPSRGLKLPFFNYQIGPRLDEA
ncbi:hypothetical protein [Paenibacillus alginolyticus]|uniref:Uncharacterized protein n=1 Tax=Paenibacillus alginolyticus TaxID=59839 RepID=A0ABT4GIR1_9BACL|nr:hypothetical protein [Paenibacillus alginolyticus]MCY9696094.1 hypothetical protein [Paenibacillus alginolyticus]MEC0143374.1 hypothetical protein [Paenibacillus alginolyticus]